MEKRNTNPPNNKVLKRRPKKHRVRDVLNERSLVPIVESEREGVSRGLSPREGQKLRTFRTSLKAPLASEKKMNRPSHEPKRTQSCKGDCIDLTIINNNEEIDSTSLAEALSLEEMKMNTTIALELNAPDTSQSLSPVLTQPVSPPSNMASLYHASREQHRQKVVETIEHRLKEKNSSLGPEELRKSALCVERLLFHQMAREGKCSEYGDSSALNERLAPILHLLRMRKDSKSKPLSRREMRQQVLRKCLGSRFVKVLGLVQEINRLRLDHASLGCAKCRVKCGKDSCYLPPAKQDSTFPVPVRDLFFHVDLVRMMETLSVNDIPGIKLERWEEWMKEAETIVETYKEWNHRLHGDH